MKDTIIEVRELLKEYGGEAVVNYISFSVAEGEFVTLLGPSGCGKTTILRLLAGFEKPTGGDIFLYGKKINDMLPFERPVNTVFQNYALFPHLNVYENIAFPLKIKKLPKKTIEEKVSYYLEVVNLTGFGKRDVESLSGGQQQRVAIARALANEPKVLLLDEPLSALDLKLRKEMQNELKRIQQEVEITFIYVTHDQEEALSLSDKVIVMRKGEILQIGSPIDIYNEPINAYVAGFIGESNIIDGTMSRSYEVDFLGKAFMCVDRKFPETNQVKVLIRPEDIGFSAIEGSKLPATIKSVTFKGVHYEYTAEVDGFIFLIHSTISKQEGEAVGLTFTPNDIHIMRAEQRNIIPALVDNNGHVEFLGGVFECEYDGEGTDVLAVIKPADWIIYPPGDPSAKLHAVIQNISYHSERYECVARCQDSDLMIESISPLKMGEVLGLDVHSDDIAIIRDEQALEDMDNEDIDEEERDV